MHYPVTFPSGTVNYHFISRDAGPDILDIIGEKYDLRNVIFVTNEHIAGLYSGLFNNYKCLVLPATEQSKDLDTIGTQVKALLAMEATRNTVLVGVGGGVITDFTGFLASVYMRGVSFGFVPTSLLSMVDAAIGGKNGVNAGLNKNIIGTITQPEFIIYDTSFLDTLPTEEWSNGFAEIIKYACIFDAQLFDELEKTDLSFYREKDNYAISQIIEKCVSWKNKTVVEDETEKGIRKLLNFGHTAAHAIENLYQLSHGQAVSIGMIIACLLSEFILGLDKSTTERLKNLLMKYGLPVQLNMDVTKVMEILKMDKKRKDETIDYILLEQTGKAVIKPLPLPLIENTLVQWLY